MKQLLTLLLCLACTLAWAQTEPRRVKIQDAVAEKLIEYDLRGVNSSPRWTHDMGADGGYNGKCMVLRLRNLAGQPLEIVVPNGLMLMCDNKQIQDMVVTKTVESQLPSDGRDTLILYAMCSEMHDGGPHFRVNYQVGEMADKSLSAIVKVIEEMDKYYIEGQGAVWAYRDQATANDLRAYGATNATLKGTYKILDRAGVVTKLHPKLNDGTAKPAPVAVVADTVAAPVEPAIEPQKWYEETITIPVYYAYAAGGVVFILFTTTIIFSRRPRKKNSGTVS